MKLNRLEVLDKNEIQMIHNTTLELLETVGIRVESQEIRDFLKENAFGTDLRCLVIKSSGNLTKCSLLVSSTIAPFFLRKSLVS